MAGPRRFFYRYLGSRMMISIIFNAFTVYFLWKIVVGYRSVFLAGMIATIALAVALVTAVPVGHLIDRLNSTIVSLLASLISLAGVCLLLFSSNLNIIYTVSGFLALSFTMKGDSFSAIMKKHLKEENYASGNSLSQAASFLSTLGGIALGGIAISHLEPYFVYSLLSIAVASGLTSLPMPEASSRDLNSKASSEIASAIGFYRKILGFIAVAFVLNGLFESLDVYSSGLFHLVLNASSIYYTLFVASISVGGIAGAGLASLVRERINNPVMLSLLVLCYAPLFMILGVSPSPLIDIVDGTLVGILLSVINVPLQTKLMKIIPNRIYGKVMAFLRVFLSGATPAMAAVLSFVSIFLRVDLIFLYIGIIMLPVSALSFVVLPKFFSMAANYEGNTSAKLTT